MANFTDSASSKSIDQREHNNDASSKRVHIRGQEPTSGDWVNINATDNGDGSYSLKTSIGNATANVLSPLDGYGTNDIEEGATYTYIGLEDASGNWIIKRIVNASGVTRYASGTSAYSTAWTNRASQTYNTFDDEFDPVTGSLITSATDINAVIKGTLDSGDTQALNSTAEGHLEVAIHGPRNPFGSLHAEKMTPVFQTDSVYGINPSECITTTGHSTDGVTSATVTGTNNLFKVSTGTTAYSFSTLQSRKRLRYRAGQGARGRFTALFSTPAASSILVAGLGTAESGFYFGYNGTSFGILYSTGGVREIQTLTITTASSATNDIQITLPSATGTREFTVTGITDAGGDATITAKQIAAGTFEGWSAEQLGDTIIFLRKSVGVLTGTPLIAQSGAGTPAAGSYVETLTGVAGTDTWIAQSSWNGDKLDGTGASGVTIDPQKGNVFEIDIQYLGFGAIVFRVEAGLSGNNPDFVTVHTLNIPNSRTTTTVSNPSFPFTMAAYSAGSTTDVSVSTASFAGFIEGDIRLTGPRASFSNTSTSVSTTNYYCLFSIRNDLTHAHTGTTLRANQSVVNILSFGGAHDDATPVRFYLLRNATLAGTTNWTKWSEESCLAYDTGATTATISKNSQIVQVLPVGQGGSVLIPLEDTTTLQPGETMTVAATTVTGTSTWTIATLNTREDQ